jgi:hypothetical protein
MIATLQIQRRENGRTMQTVQQLINPRQRISVPHCHLVETPVVNTHAKSAILLLDEQHRGPIRRRTGLNQPFRQQLADLFLHLFSFLKREAIRAAERRDSSWL